MTTPAANANGHRRRQLVARILAEEDHCGICDQPVDKALTFLTGQHGPRCTSPDCEGCIPHPERAEVDEIIPRALGGSPTSRANTHLVHRRCNQVKRYDSLEWARSAILGNHVNAPIVGTNLVDW